jgi:hypothetical protein
MKTKTHADRESTRRRPVVDAVPSPLEGAPSNTSALGLQASARTVTQRQRIEAAFGATTAAAPLQAKFAGSLGPLLAALSPALLGVQDNIYASLWTDLNNAVKVIKVEQGPLGYEQDTQTLYLDAHMLHGLVRHGTLEPKVKASWVALVTHELSHAHDHVIKAREVRTPVRAGVEGHTKDVIETELRAWAREALSAHKVSPKDLDDEKRELREGWQGITTDMLKNLATYAASNAVIGRLLRYAQRELEKKVNTNDPDVGAQEWADRHRVWLEGEVTRLRDALAKQW